MIRGGHLLLFKVSGQMWRSHVANYSVISLLNTPIYFAMGVLLLFILLLGILKLSWRYRSKTLNASLYGNVTCTLLPSCAPYVGHWDLHLTRTFKFWVGLCFTNTSFVAFFIFPNIVCKISILTKVLLRTFMEMFFKWKSLHSTQNYLFFVRPYFAWLSFWIFPNDFLFAIIKPLKTHSNLFVMA